MLSGAPIDPKSDVDAQGRPAMGQNLRARPTDMPDRSVIHWAARMNKGRHRSDVRSGERRAEVDGAEPARQSD